MKTEIKTEKCPFDTIKQITVLQCGVPQFPQTKNFPFMRELILTDNNYDLKEPK